MESIKAHVGKLVPQRWGPPASRRSAALLQRGLCLLVAVSAAGACDSVLRNDEAKSVKEKAPAKARRAPPDTKAVVAPAPDSALGLVQAFSGCARSCLDEIGLATNRATCKLNCEGAASAGREGLVTKPDPELFDKAIAEAGVCTDGCYSDLSSADRETCLLICGQTVEMMLGEA